MSLENHKSFLERFVFLPENDILDIELAYVLAKHWFRSKFRKEIDENGDEVRYFEHLRRVSLILVDELKLIKTPMVIAAIMHDAYEDTRKEDLAIEQIEKQFGKDITYMVKLLSKVPSEGYLERLMNFADWRVLFIKAADRLDNLRTLKAGSIEFQRKQINETRVKYYPLFDKMVSIAPAEHVQRAAYLREQIRSITDNFIFEEVNGKKINIEV